MRFDTCHLSTPTSHFCLLTQETWMAQATLLSSWLRRLELYATINSEVVIASESVAEMCATKNKSCAMLHHTHDVTQGISSDVAKTCEVKWHCTDPTEVRTFAPWATGSFEDGHHGTYGYNTCRTSIWPRPINQGQDFIDLGIVQIAELFTLRCDQTLSVSGSPKSYHNIRWITAVQGHVRTFFIFWLGSFLCS